MEDIKITLQISTANGVDIPMPTTFISASSGTKTYSFKDKEELIAYTGQLYAQYIKFKDPETGLIADLLRQIGQQIK